MLNVYVLSHTLSFRCWPRYEARSRSKWRILSMVAGGKSSECCWTCRICWSSSMSLSRSWLIWRVTTFFWIPFPQSWHCCSLSANCCSRSDFACKSCSRVKVDERDEEGVGNIGVLEGREGWRGDDRVGWGVCCCWEFIIKVYKGR